MLEAGSVDFDTAGPVSQMVTYGAVPNARAGSWGRAKEIAIFLGPHSSPHCRGGGAVR